MDKADPPSSPAPSELIPRNPVSSLRVSLILVAGLLVGNFTGVAVTLRQPKIYEVQARVEGAEHQGHEKEITLLRAKMATRTDDWENKWATTFDQAAEQVRKAVRLKSDEQGVTIKVRHLNPLDAHAIASRIASTIDTPAREKELADKGIRIGPERPEDRAKLKDIVKLENLLADQALEAGFKGSWAKVLLGPGEDPVLIELAKNEDFARRLSALKELVVEYGLYGPPGEPIRILPRKISVEDIPSAPVSPNVALWINGFRALGLALAGLLILASLRWKPTMLRKKPRTTRSTMPKKQIAAENKDPW